MAPVRAPLILLASLALLAPACNAPPSSAAGEVSPDAGPPDALPPDLAPLDAGIPDRTPTHEAGIPEGGIHLRVLTANVGNLDGVWKKKDLCPGYYQGAQCEPKTELQIAKALAAYRPDIVVLNEVFDADYCAGKNEKDPRWICNDHKNRSPYQQARRYLGAGYTIVCDGIAHYDCIGIKASRFTVKECASGKLCVSGAQTPAHPPACKGIGSITSVSAAHLTLGGRGITVINGHPLNAVDYTGDACRHAQYKQIFETLADPQRTLIMGDMNGDPINFGSVFDSFKYWNTVVGKGKRFRYHSGPAEGSPPPATWQPFFTLDYVLSDFLVGTCRTLGAVLEVHQLDYPINRMDHKAIVCDLVMP